MQNRLSKLILCGVMLVLAGCAGGPDVAPTTYDKMRGWNNDAHFQALESFMHSCERASPPHMKGLIAKSHSISKTRWKTICNRAEAVERSKSDRAAKQFFEREFAPYNVSNRGKRNGIFTGYYIPVLNGSLTRTSRYQYPAYRVPARVHRKNSHAAITNGALRGKGYEILWLDDDVMLFFAQIQGSALVRLQSGEIVKLAYAGKNGHSYFAIGKALIEEEEIAKEDMSLQALRKWLYEAREVDKKRIMHMNRSYVYFKLERGDHVRDILGAGSVPLTGGRSLAVDDEYIPYHLPMYLNTTLPTGQNYRRLMMTQDTGGAIRGKVRGDVYFGIGEQAERKAGAMNNKGKWTILLPRP